MKAQRARAEVERLTRAALYEDTDPVPSLERLLAGELTIEPKIEVAEQLIDLIWNGRSTERQPGKVILPFATTWLDEARRVGFALRMHFETVDHMNSSSVTAIIQIIQEARIRGTRLIITFDPKRKWQKLSFDALRVFVKPDGSLEITGTEAPAPT